MLSAKSNLTQITPKDFKRMKAFHKFTRLGLPIPKEPEAKFVQYWCAKYDWTVAYHLHQRFNFK